MGKDWGFTLLVLVGICTHFASTVSHQEVGLTRHIRATTFLHFIFVRYQPLTLTDFSRFSDILSSYKGKDSFFVFLPGNLSHFLPHINSVTDNPLLNNQRIISDRARPLSLTKQYIQNDQLISFCILFFHSFNHYRSFFSCFSEHHRANNYDSLSELFLFISTLK